MNEEINKISFCVFGFGFKSLKLDRRGLGSCETGLTYDVTKQDNDVTQLIGWSERIEVLGRKIAIEKKSDCDVIDYSVVTSESLEISGGWSFDDDNCDVITPFTDDDDYLRRRIPSIVTSSPTMESVALPLITSSNNRVNLPMTSSNNNVNVSVTSNNHLTLPPIMTSPISNGDATKEEIKKFKRTSTSSMTDDVTTDSLFDSAGLKRSLKSQIIGVMKKNPDGKVPNGKSPNGRAKGEQLLRVEANRFERMRDDLIHRNQFLKKQILTEKSNSKTAQNSGRIEELKSKNREVKLDLSGVWKNFDSSKSRLAAAEQNYERSIQLLCDVTIQKKEEEGALKIANQSLEKKSSEFEKLKIEKKLFMEKLKTFDCDVIDSNKHLNNEETKRMATEKKQKVSMEEHFNLKQILIQTEIRFRDSSHRNQILKQNYDVITSRLNGLKKDSSKIEDKVAKLTNEFSSKLKDLDEANSVSKKLSVDVKKLQDLFHAKEEIKRNAVSLSSQTTGRLVAVRDIAWIKVAQEEIILSPNCGNSRRGAVSSDRNCFTVGSVAPVFEVYDFSPDVTSSPRHPIGNKRLCDDREGAEFVWTGEGES